MQIFIWYGGKTYTFDVEPSDTIENIKYKIVDKGIVNQIYLFPHYRLQFRSNLYLDDEKTLADYNIQKEDTIYLFVKNPNSLRNTIKIKFKNDIIEMDFPCFCCYSIFDYKKEIYKKRGYPVEYQNLYSDENGKNLLNNDDKESIPVFLRIDEDNLHKGYKIIYYDGHEEYNIISGYDLESIKEIKDKIKKEYNLPKGSFELIYDYNALSDSKKLSDYNIYYESKIYLVIEEKYEKFLFITSHFSVTVKYKEKFYTTGMQDYTILGIKKYFMEYIIKNSNIKISQIKIIFQGKILDDNVNIQDKGIGFRKMELFITD